MLTDNNSPKELLEQALIALNREHQRRLQNQGTSYGHDKYRKRAEKKIADYENAILILSKKEANFISSKPDVSGQMPPSDEEIEKEVLATYSKIVTAFIKSRKKAFAYNVSGI